MYNRALRYRTNLRVNESTLRLAEKLAAKYRVTVSYLIEILLLALKERSEWEPPTQSPQRAPARVIDLNARRRRQQTA